MLKHVRAHFFDAPKSTSLIATTRENSMIQSMLPYTMICIYLEIYNE